MKVDSKELINKFIDTHPDFMRAWPLKTRMGFRKMCDYEQIKEFFDRFLEWHMSEFEKVLDEEIDKCDAGWSCPVAAKLGEE